MRTRNLWLLTGLVGVAAALLAAGPALVASHEFDLSTTQEAFVSGGIAELDVSIEPIFVGGTADLYRTIAGNTELVMSFQLTAPEFQVEAGVPTGHVGQAASFHFQAFGPGGESLGDSRKVRRPIVEPIVE